MGGVLTSGVSHPTQVRRGDRVEVPTVQGPRDVRTYGTYVRADRDNPGYGVVRLDHDVMGERVHSIEYADIRPAEVS